MKYCIYSLVFLLALTFIPHAASQCDLNVGSFGGSLGLPLSLGFYNLSQINLKVCSIGVTGSIPGYLQLLNGVFDVFGGTLTDNAFSRYYDPQDYPGQTIVMLGETAFNSPLTTVGVRYNITTPEQLRGANILVDSPVSGYIITLERILSLYNLFVSRGDYTLIALGANRFPSLYQGYVTINGTNIPIQCTVCSPPQGAYMSYDPLYYAPVVRSFGQLSDWLNPLSGGSIQTKPSNLLNTTLYNKIVKYMAASLLGNRFQMNPDNKPYLISLLANQYPNSTADFLDFLYNYTSGPNAGLVQDFQFNTQGLLNEAYIKQEFGGYPFNNTDYGNLKNPNPGGIINYGPRNAALPTVNAIAQVKVNTNKNFVFPSFCLYPGIDYTTTFYGINGNGILAGVVNKSSGGCTNVVPIKAQFLGCTSNSTYFAQSQCQYNPSSDSLTFNSNLSGCGETTRYYFTSFFVREPCGGNVTFTQTTVVQRYPTPGTACTLLV